jgi:hypothetical protein
MVWESCFSTHMMIRYGIFHSLLLYGILFWGNPPNAKLIFKLQKRAIRAMMEIQKTTSCKQYFNYLHIFPLPCLYIYETLVYTKSNLNTLATNSEIHLWEPPTVASQTDNLNSKRDRKFNVYLYCMQLGQS